MLGPPKLRCLDRPVAVSLEALVPPDNFYRHLDAKLDLSFVRALVRDRYAVDGRPSIDPVVFFKLQLVMFFEGIRSERKLIEAASLHLAHRWYLGYHLDEPLPDHSSLTRIRDRYGLAIFRRFFEHVVALCEDAGLVWGKELFFDATKVRANASVDSLRTRLREVAREHLAELFGPDAPEPAEAGAAPAAASAVAPAEIAEHPDAVTPTPLRPPGARHAQTASTAREPARWDLLEQCRLDPDRPAVNGYRRTTDFRASTTDPDAAPMSSGGKAALGYHDHYVVDGGRRRIILYALVTPADVMENQPMLDLLRRVRFRWRLRPKRAIGDTTYGTVQNIRALEDEGIRAYVPLPDFDARTPFYGASRFAYDAERDAYRCPQGQRLHRLKAEYTDEVVIYRADAATCNACAVKAACTSGAHGRQVRRSFHAAYLERVKAYHETPAYQKAMRKRKIWVEPLFGEAKEWHGLRRFRLRGLPKVNTEGLLIAAGQNLKRWLAATGWGRRHGPCGSLFSARSGDGTRCRTRRRAARHRPVAGRPAPSFSTRSGVVARHPSDQLPDLDAQARAPGSDARAPAPEQRPAAAVPADDRRGPDEHEVPAPVAPSEADQQPEEPVPGAEARALAGGARQDSELLARQQVLSDQVAAVADGRATGPRGGAGTRYPQHVPTLRIPAPGSSSPPHRPFGSASRWTYGASAWTRRDQVGGHARARWSHADGVGYGQREEVTL